MILGIKTILTKKKTELNKNNYFFNDIKKVRANMKIATDINNIGV